MGKGDRPEHTNPPDIFYNDAEARKYTTSSRMVEIQVPDRLWRRRLTMLTLATNGRTDFVVNDVIGDTD